MYIIYDVILLLENLYLMRFDSVRFLLLYYMNRNDANCIRTIPLIDHTYTELNTRNYPHSMFVCYIHVCTIPGILATLLLFIVVVIKHLKVSIPSFICHIGHWIKPQNVFDCLNSFMSMHFVLCQYFEMLIASHTWLRKRIFNIQ